MISYLADQSGLSIRDSRSSKEVKVSAASVESASREIGSSGRNNINSVSSEGDIRDRSSMVRDSKEKVNSESVNKDSMSSENLGTGRPSSASGSKDSVGSARDSGETGFGSNIASGESMEELSRHQGKRSYSNILMVLTILGSL